VLLSVDPASATPLFVQLADAVRSEASRGALKAGDRLPPAKEVARSLEVNLHTVLKAYQLLREEGLVDLRRGRGAVLTDKVVSLTELGREIPRLVEFAKKQGIGASALAALVREEYSR
jgi:GntR family transcriptional regulator